MPPPVPSVTSITLRWLSRLRWIGVAGQMTALAVSRWMLELDLPWKALLAVLAFTIASNLVLVRSARDDQPGAEWQRAAVIAMDVLLLTVMIYLTGGASNPFTSLYLVLVALAAMSLRGSWLGAIVALSTAGYFFVFYHGLPLRGPGGIGEIGCPGYGLHLKGMAAAFFLTSVCVGFFVRKMHDSLQHREAALTEAETKAARVEQFSALAALSAGVAHELGSPLGTIAVASRELERALERSGSNDTLEDARLIRQEVERCRVILDRLDRRSTAGTGDAPVSCTAAAIMREVIDSLPEAMKRRVTVHDRTGGATMHLPRQPVVQSLIILVQNACEADESARTVEVGLSHDDGGLRLEVLDRGAGMSEAVRKRAGEPFFTTKPPRQGMGLGLFLVRTLAMQLGGELTHVSRDGGGTSASLSLPVTAIST